MKFKYIGEDGCFCLELVAYDLCPDSKYLKKGQIIDVPNDLKRVINALDANGVFIRVKDNKKVTRKVKKEDKK